LRDTHHIFWPRRAYKTPLEQRFRNLPCNKVTIEVESHDILHRFTQPPNKPTIEYMEYMVAKNRRPPKR